MTLLPDTEHECRTLQPVATNRHQESPEDLSLVRMDEKANLKRSTSTEECRSEEGTEKKRQRVENIVTSISQPRSPKPFDLTSSNIEQEPKNKRKQFVPQQHGLSNGNEAIAHGPFVSPVPNGHNREDGDKEKELLRDQLKIMGEQLQRMHQRYQEMFERRELDRYELLSKMLPAMHPPHFDTEAYIRSILSEVTATVKMSITETLEKSFPLIKEKLSSQSLDFQHNFSREHSSHSVPDPIKRLTPGAPLIHTPLPQPAHNPLSIPSHLFHPFYYGQSLVAASQLATQQAMENEYMDGAFRDINMNKKKRTKVTDARLSPRSTSKPLDQPAKAEHPEVMGKAFEAYADCAPPLFPSLHSGISIRNSLTAHSAALTHGSAIGSNFHESPRSGMHSPTNLSDCSNDGSSPDLSASGSLFTAALPGQTVTLTPLHLRKAKLMFFYVRYPSSILLKNCFCDVHFNKNNTAQLVKWFSNFREFYYIQMEKYARQAIAEGLSADYVEVTTEHELYKILNLHYNRNNQIEVPSSFCEVIQATLREFVKAISTGKDREQSWKKPIYKVIARLDDTVPEYFKSQEWLDQLGD